ncbi:MAG TPA: DNRLRE domain-containing protein, partial [Chthoniobacteraceae bacterium]|nr:DNRLRE domain-containing protein [Chthoniobacteraceae bacterium]
MKLLPLALWLSLSAFHLQAATIPVLEDTSSKNELVSKKSGAAGNLPVASNRSAFIRFDLQPLGGSLAPTDSIRARLTFYIQKVSIPGTVTLRAVTSDWTESPDASTPPPTVDSEALTTVSAGADASKQFVTVDVTAQVVDWLASPETNFGVAVQSDGTASILLGAKEGPGSGYPAVLDIEKKSAIGNDHVLAGIDTIKLGTGSVDNAEFTYLDGLTSSIQLQLNDLSSDLDAVEVLSATIGDKVSKAGDTMT